jgi:hypothetical protein
MPKFKKTSFKFTCCALSLILAGGLTFSQSFVAHAETTIKNNTITLDGVPTEVKTNSHYARGQVIKFNEKYYIAMNVCSWLPSDPAKQAATPDWMEVTKLFV